MISGGFFTGRGAVRAVRLYLSKACAISRLSGKRKGATTNEVTINPCTARLIPQEPRVAESFWIELNINFCSERDVREQWVCQIGFERVKHLPVECGYRW
jgi:hypothetical protein